MDIGSQHTRANPVRCKSSLAALLMRLVCCGMLGGYPTDWLAWSAVLLCSTWDMRWACYRAICRSPRLGISRLADSVPRDIEPMCLLGTISGSGILDAARSREMSAVLLRLAQSGFYSAMHETPFKFSSTYSMQP